MDLLNLREQKTDDLVHTRDGKNVDRRGTTGTVANSTLASGATGNAGKEIGTSMANSNFSYPTTVATIPANAGAADICQMCIILGIQVMCPNDATKRKHTDDHRRSAAAFLSLEEWALPPTESQIGKCFPLYAQDVVQRQQQVVCATQTHMPQGFINSGSSVQAGGGAAAPTANKFGTHLQQRQQQLVQPPPPPPQQQQQSQVRPQRVDNEKIQQTVAAILLSSNYSPNHQPLTAEGRAASISAAVAAVASIPTPVGDNDDATVASSQKRTKPRSSGGSVSKKRATFARPANASPIKVEGSASAASTAKELREQLTKNVVAAIETTLHAGDVETNFQVVRDKPSCKWPRFIIDGYAYRVGRVYSTGKCELRCILKQGCNGKAVVEKNGATYVARIVPGSMHFHSPPTFSKADHNAS